MTTRSMVPVDTVEPVVPVEASLPPLPEASEAFARELTQIFDERGGAMAAVPHPLVIKGLGHLIRSGQVAEAHRIVAGSDLQLEVHGTRENGSVLPLVAVHYGTLGEGESSEKELALGLYAELYERGAGHTYVNAVATDEAAVEASGIAQAVGLPLMACLALPTSAGHRKKQLWELEQIESRPRFFHFLCPCVLMATPVSLAATIFCAVVWVYITGSTPGVEYEEAAADADEAQL